MPENVEIALNNNRQIVIAEIIEDTDEYSNLEVITTRNSKYILKIDKTNGYYEIIVEK